MRNVTSIKKLIVLTLEKKEIMSRLNAFDPKVLIEGKYGKFISKTSSRLCTDPLPKLQMIKHLLNGYKGSILLIMLPFLVDYYMNPRLSSNLSLIHQVIPIFHISGEYISMIMIWNKIGRRLKISGDHIFSVQTTLCR